jgi:hypothetical protein
MLSDLLLVGVLPLKVLNPKLSHLSLVKANSAKRQFKKLNRQLRIVAFPLPKKFFDTFCEPYNMRQPPPDREAWCQLR